MKKRILGKSGLEVSAIGLGRMGLSQSDLLFSDKAEFTTFLHRAVKMGETLFDISEVYDIYEDIIGEALGPLRNQIIIATKFSWDIQDGKVLELVSGPQAYGQRNPTLQPSLQ